MKIKNSAAAKVDRATSELPKRDSVRKQDTEDEKER